MQHQHSPGLQPTLDDATAIAATPQLPVLGAVGLLAGCDTARCALTGACGGLVADATRERWFARPSARATTACACFELAQAKHAPPEGSLERRGSVGLEAFPRATATTHPDPSFAPRFAPPLRRSSSSSAAPARIRLRNVTLRDRAAGAANSRKDRRGCGSPTGLG